LSCGFYPLNLHSFIHSFTVAISKAAIQYSEFGKKKLPDRIAVGFWLGVVFDEERDKVVVVVDGVSVVDSSSRSISLVVVGLVVVA